MYLGAHMSIAGGLHLACLRGRELGCDVIQIFTRNQQQWRAQALSDEDVAAFRKACREQKIRAAFAHGSYLINPASPDPAVRRRSIDAIVDELVRCERLGLAFVVQHTGSSGETGERAGIRTALRSLDQALRRTRGLRARLLLETSAGQGAGIGSSFGRLREMVEGVSEPERVGVCFDTCHVFAAGYDLRARAAYEATMEEFDGTVGLRRLEAFHVNDSKKGLGSRVDRHEHIGRGQIGIEAFRCLMKDPRFARVPKVIETPKEHGMDARNLRILRRLVA